MRAPATRRATGKRHYPRLVPRRFLTACFVVALAATTSCSVVVGADDGPERAACAPATSISLDPVDGGDVNTMFVKTAVTGPDGPVVGGDVTFLLIRRGAPGRDFLQAPATDAQGASLLDLGGHVTASKDYREAVEDAVTLTAEYAGRSATSDRTRLCPSSRSVPFSPDNRAYERADTEVARPEQLVEGLRAVGRVLESDGPYRMPDGQSPCRALVALLDELARHPGWFEPVTLRNASDRTEATLSTCVTAPLLSSVQVGQIASVLSNAS